MKKNYLFLVSLFSFLLLSYFGEICYGESGDQPIKGTVTITTSHINNTIFTSELVGCSSYATKTGTVLTKQLLISDVPEKKLYIKGLDVYNLSTTAGIVELYWDATGTDPCYYSAVGGAVGNGFIVDVERSKQGGGLYITTVPTSVALIIYYIQQ